MAKKEIIITKKRENIEKKIINNQDNVLDDRKKQLLKIIIKMYLETGEPVGSRTISKEIEKTLSSATIRNEMSDLEELGYIKKPHTSAGRIPSDKGYRFYVDDLIKEKDQEIKDVKTELFERVDKLEYMLKGLVKKVASNTNYAALIKGPNVNTSKIKYVQISNIEEKKLLIVTVAEGNIIKTKILDTEKITAKEILDISVVLNNILSGLSIEDIKKDSFIEQNKNQINSHKEIKNIINSIIEMFEEENADTPIYTSGTNNLFKYKEFEDNNNAKTIIETFEQKKDLTKLLTTDDNNSMGIKVYIGEESTIDSMKDCSVITANCNFGNGLQGTIGVVGPKRMDYEKVLKSLKTIMLTAHKEFKKDN